MGDVRAMMSATETLTARLPELWGQSAARTKYILADLAALIAKPQVLGDIHGEHTQMQLKNIRDDIAKQLHVSVQEANRIMDLMFKDWNPQKNLGGKMGKSVDEVQAQIAKLRAQLARNLAFGKLDNGPIIKSIRDLQSQVERINFKKAIKAAEDAGQQIPTRAAAGMDRGKGHVKTAAEKLVDLTQVPFKTSGAKFDKYGTEAGGKFGSGVGKGKGKAKAGSQALAGAAKGPVAAAVGPMTASGTSAAMGFAAGVGSMAAVNQAATNAARLAQAAIDAVKATGGESSPWKTTMQSGVNAVLGFVLGIKKGKREAISAASDLASSILSVFDAALGIGADIGSLQAGGLPTNKIAKKWAHRVGAMMRTLIVAMQRELKSIDIGKAVKEGKGTAGKDAGWKAEAFGSVVSMAEGVGSIFTSFADLTVEKITASLAGMKLARSKAGQWGSAAAGLVKALIHAAKGIVVSEFSGGNAGRIVEMVNGIASLIGVFGPITGSAIDDAIMGLSATAQRAGDLSGAVAYLAREVAKAFKDTKIGETVSAAASAGMQIANDLAGSLTTFGALTDEGVDDGITGLNRVAAKSGLLTTAILAMVVAVAAAWGDATVKEALVTAFGSGTQVAGDLVGLITNLAAMSEKAVLDGISGAGRVVASAPAFGAAMRGIVGALAVELAGVIVSPELAAASSASTGIVSEITGAIASLGTMTAAAIQDGIWGAGWVAYRAKDLGAALKVMLDHLSAALGGVGVDSLTDLSGVLGQLREITDAISSIVSSLAGMTPEQLSLATSAGASLGAGFYAGLFNWRDRSIALARDMATQTAAALGGAGGGFAPAYVYAGASVGKPAPTQVTVNDNSQLLINLPPSLSAAEARSIAQREIGAFEARKAEAKRAAIRGSVR